MLVLSHSCYNIKFIILQSILIFNYYLLSHIRKKRSYIHHIKEKYFLRCIKDYILCIFNFSNLKSHNFTI